LHRKGEKEREAGGTEREDPYLKVRQLELVGACLPSSSLPEYSHSPTARELKKKKKKKKKKLLKR
jgi:hypothetical protein